MGRTAHARQCAAGVQNTTEMKSRHPDLCPGMARLLYAFNSEAADAFSKALGSRTVLSGSVSRGKNDPSQSLQMMERPLLTADEFKSILKGSFIVQKTGCHPMRTRLRLFLEWGITFEEEYRVEEQAARKVYYADQDALTRAITRKYPPKLDGAAEHSLR